MVKSDDKEVKLTPRRLLNANKTSPLDSFYNQYAENIRLKGNRYLTVFDFVVTCNVRLLLEYNKLTAVELSKLCGMDSSAIRDFLELKKRFGADDVFKVATALKIPMSELYVDRASFAKEEPSYRFS